MLMPYRLPGRMEDGVLWRPRFSWDVGLLTAPCRRQWKLPRAPGCWCRGKSRGLGIEWTTVEEAGTAGTLGTEENGYKLFHVIKQGHVLGLKDKHLLFLVFFSESPKEVRF